MSVPKRLVIIGAGGQARDLAWLVSELNRQEPRFELLGFVVSDLSRLGPHDSPVLGDYGWLESNTHRVDALALGIGTPVSRIRVATDLGAAFPNAEWPVLVHPRVTLDWDSARLERGSCISAGVAGTVNVTLEEFALVNVGCTLGHEAMIGRGSVVNHGASISGGVRVGSSVLVGTGARVLQYLDVGEGAVVGAGAVVTRNVPAGVTVVGVPARPVARGVGAEEKP